MNGDLISAVPTDLGAEGRRLADAASEVQQISVRLRAPLPAMPADVAAYVEAELGGTQVALAQIAGGLLDEAAVAGCRGQLFEAAGEGGLDVALGGALGTVEQLTNPWVDGLERVLIAPRYVRFGTWVTAYSYVNRYGTVVNVGRHWRNLPNKVMDEKPVFAGIGEDSAYVKGARIAGRASVALTFVTSGLDEWNDTSGGTTERLAKSGAVGTATAGGAWAGAEMGAMAGATIGSAVPLVGTAVGGVVGGLVGAFVGSEGGSIVGHFLAGHL